MICKPDLFVTLLATALVLAGCSSERRAGPEGTGQAQADPEFVRLLEVAEARMAEGELADAGRLLDAARARDADNPDLWVAIARLRFRGGEHLTALEAADRALTLGPDHSPALLMRALMVRDAHGFADAVPWFEAAIAADPENADAWAEYAATLGDLGRNRAMLDAVRELAVVAPGNPRVFWLQAVLAERGGQPVLARSLLDRSGMAARGVPAALLLDTLIDLDQGNYASAAERLETLAARQPANPRWRELLARTLLLSGREAELVERFAAEALQPEASPYLAMLVGRAYERLGERAAAAPLLERGFTAARADPVVLTPRVGLPAPAAALRDLAAEGAGPTLRNKAGDFRARFPASADFAQLAGDAALADADGAAALAAYAPAARVRRPWPLTRKAVFAYERIGEGIAAETLLARHVAGEPDNIPGLVALARVLARRGDTERAALLLDHAIALGGGHDAALLALRAELALVLGRAEEAARFTALATDLLPHPLAASR